MTGAIPGKAPILAGDKAHWNLTRRTRQAGHKLTVHHLLAVAAWLFLPGVQGAAGKVEGGFICALRPLVDQATGAVLAGTLRAWAKLPPGGLVLNREGRANIQASLKALVHLRQEGLARQFPGLHHVQAFFHPHPETVIYECREDFHKEIAKPAAQV
jgi:hypothetical protein